MVFVGHQAHTPIAGGVTHLVCGGVGADYTGFYKGRDETIAIDWFDASFSPTFCVCEVVVAPAEAIVTPAAATESATTSATATVGQSAVHGQLLIRFVRARDVRVTKTLVVEF